MCKKNILKLNEQEIIQHHLAPLYFERFKIKKYKEIWKSNWQRNELLLCELKIIEEHFNKNKLKYHLLKGSYLIKEGLYTISERFLSDIDIYIPTDNLENAEKILKKLNFKLLDERKFKGNNFKRVWNKSETTIELHTKTAWPCNNESKSNFSHEKTFAYLIYHYAIAHNFLKIYWAYDILFYQQKYSLNPKKLKIELKRYEALTAAGIVGAILLKHFNERSILLNFRSIKSNFLSLFISFNFIKNGRQRDYTKIFIKLLIVDNPIKIFNYFFSKTISQ